MADFTAASSSIADIQAKIDEAGPGVHRVLFPDAPATWASIFNLYPYMTLEAMGDSLITTTVNSSQGSVRLFSYSVLKNVTFHCTGNSGQAPAFGVATDAIGWRITDVTWTSSAISPAGGRFLDLATGATWGLIDNCTITGPTGTSELIYTKGPADAWDTPTTLGTDQAVYVEYCTFNGQGYVSDFNANSKGVVRFCTINGSIKVDAHGLRTNSPQKSTRHWEVYNNTWTGTGNFRAADLRGGTGVLFNNTVAPGLADLSLNDYCYLMRPAGDVFGNIWQTPIDWPVEHQIGRGMHTIPGVRSSAQSEPVYVWGNRQGGVLMEVGHGNPITPGYTLTTNSAAYSVGATSITFTGTTAIAAGNYIAIVGDNTRYLVTIGRTGSGPISISPPLVVAIPASPVTGYHRPQSHYQGQVGSPTALFTGAMLIQKNRDFFEEVVNFTGVAGVGIGTRAQMDAIVPSFTNVGFWVTDEGSWNTLITPNTSGRLYVWTGSAWTFKYEPYTYPHPLRGALAAPTISVQPVSNTVEEGQNVAFLISASGNPSPTFQWRKGGVAISGQTSTSLSFINAQLTDAGTYDCVVTNSQGSVPSDSFTLTVNPLEVSDPPVITVQPVSVTTFEAEDVTFTIAATGDNDPSYQWYKNGVAISGETGTTLFLSNVTEADEATYYCVVSNAGGSVSSNTVSLTVNPLPTIPVSTANPLGSRGSRAMLFGII